MTALPADDATPLRSVPSHEALMRGLVTPRDIAATYETDRQATRKILARHGAPLPVAQTSELHRNRPEPLYRAVDVDRFINSLQGTDGVFGQRRRSAPVRRIGTRTPSAGRPFAWRDPARSQPIAPTRRAD